MGEVGPAAAAAAYGGQRAAQRLACVEGPVVAAGQEELAIAAGQGDDQARLSAQGQRQLLDLLALPAGIFARHETCGGGGGQQSRRLGRHQLALYGVQRLEVGIGLDLQPFDRLRQVLFAAREAASQAAHHLMLAAVVVQRALATGEVDARLWPAALGAQHLDQADLGCAVHVQAAARHPVEVADLHNAQRTVHVRLFAQVERRQFLVADDAGADWQVALHHLVSQLLGVGQLRVAEASLVQVDGQAVFAQVPGHGQRAGRLDEGLGEDVLAAVVLHVIPAPRPVDLAVDGAAGGQRCGQQVPDYVAVAAHVQHGYAVQRARVVGLAAAGGVEGCAVQRRGRLAVDLAGVDHPGVEGGEVGVVKI